MSGRSGTGRSGVGNTKLRHYCFTIFLDNWEIKDNDKIKYIIYQQEKCPKTGKLHYQGYIELNSAQRLNAVKKILGCNSAHLEPRKGTREEAINYCKKIESRVDGFWELGDANIKQGHRSDLKSAVETLKKDGYNKFIDKHPEIYVKFSNGFDKLQGKLAKPRNNKTNIIVYWGDSGVGKTKKAFEFDNNAYFKPQGKWWDGYENQDTVIIDDYEGEIEFREFLRLTDRYPMKVEIKGAFREFNSKTIIFTSNKDPMTWYNITDETSKKAFTRRLDIVERLTA